MAGDDLNAQIGVIGDRAYLIVAQDDLPRLEGLRRREPANRDDLASLEQEDIGGEIPSIGLVHAERQDLAAARANSAVPIAR